MFANPAKPGSHRQRLLHHRGGIGKYLHLTGVGGRNPPAECLKPLLQHIMVVTAAGINADGAPFRLVMHRERVHRWPIIDPDADNAPGLGPERPGIGAPGDIATHPIHIAMPPFGNVLREVAAIAPVRLGAGDSNRIEAKRLRLGPDLGGQMPNSQRHLTTSIRHDGGMRMRSSLHGRGQTPRTRGR